MIQLVKHNDAIGTVNCGVRCESGLCTLCDSACKGKCETWLASLKGRKLLYPGKFGRYPEEIFAGWEPVQAKVGKE